MRRSNAGMFTLISLVAGIAAAQQASVPVTFTQVQSSGITGVTAGQIARLNALNLSSTPAAGAAAVGCTAQVSFLDDQGVVLKTGSVTVDPGKSMAVEYTPTAAGRQTVRVTIGVVRPSTLTPTSGAAIAFPYFFCTLVPTLEIIDSSTSKTNFVMSEFHYVYAYPLPLFGVATGGAPTR